MAHLPYAVQKLAAQNEGTYITERLKGVLVKIHSAILSYRAGQYEINLGPTLSNILKYSEIFLL